MFGAPTKMAAQLPPAAHVEAKFRNAVSVIQSLPKEGARFRWVVPQYGGLQEVHVWVA